jgi:hypothetical protein
MDASTLAVVEAASGPNPSRTEEQLIAIQIAATDPFSPWAMPFWQDDPRLRRRVLLASAPLDWPLGEATCPSRPDAHRLDETALLSLIGGLEPAPPTQFSIEAAATTLNGVYRFVRSGIWEEPRPSRTVRALQGSVERAVENVAPSVGQPPPVLRVVLCLTIRGEDILKRSGAATDRFHERLPPDDEPADETDDALQVREPTVTSGRDLLGFGGFRAAASETRWDDDERMARLQLERDHALHELTGDATRNHMRRTWALAQGLRLLNALRDARVPSIKAWATGSPRTLL